MPTPIQSELDVTTASATSLAQAIRGGELSAAEAVDACLQRIEAVNGQLNAVVQITADRARLAARAADGVAAVKQPSLPPVARPWELEPTLLAASGCRPTSAASQV
jgi:Asp-tRNA(Asn)/Glu-tRNA(Gln) amidotransferase A subunit family amidase